MLSYATTLTRISQMVQDASQAIYSPTELGYLIEDDLKRIAEYDPVLVEVIYQVESRTGTDVTGTASSLTDLVKLQFVAADATKEKVVHNITDDTWAVVLANSSTSVNTLSADIMDANESYEIYNKRCKNKRQIYIGDMPPYLWIDSVEYPVGTERNFIKISRDVIELDVEDSTIQDSDSTLSTLNKVDVLIRFALSHVLCQLTDLVGEVHTAQLADATTMQIKSFTDDEVVEVGDMFNIANHRTTYHVTAGVTLNYQTAAGSNIGFYPGLEAAAPGDSIITFVESTLQPQHERILRDLVAGEVSISKASQPLQEIINAIAVLATASTAIDKMSARITVAINDETSGRTAAGLVPPLIIEAKTAVDKVDAELAQALDDLDTGRPTINTIPKGGAGVPSDYANYTARDVANARGYLEEVMGFLRLASSDESLANTYGNLAARGLSIATQSLNQGVGYLRKINTAISLAAASRYSEGWGERRIAHAERELISLANPKAAKIFPRT